MAEFAASDMDDGQVDMQLAHWSLSNLIATFSRLTFHSQHLCPIGCMRKHTTGDICVEGPRHEDISAAVKNATLNLSLQLPILKGTVAWFGTAPVNHVLGGGQGRTVCHEVEGLIVTISVTGNVMQDYSTNLYSKRFAHPAGPSWQARQ